MRLITLIGFMFPIFLMGQEVITVEDAVKKALENNHQIKISKNKKEMAVQQATPGNAGMLPSVDATGGVNVSQSKADLTFATPDIPPVQDAEAESMSYNAGLQVSYNLFDGLGSFNSYQQLKTAVELSDLQTRITIESTLTQVLNIYYQAMNLQQQLNNAETSLGISNERYARSKSKFEMGTLNSIDLLNAEVDLNNDSANYLNLQYSLIEMKSNLNLAMGVNQEVDYVLQEEIKLKPLGDLNGLKEKVMNNNVNLLLAQTNITQAEIQKKISQSFMMPRLILSGNYGYNYSETNTGIILNQQNLGLTGGVTFAWNLFDGGKKSTQLKNAKIAIENNEIAHDQAQLTVSNDFLLAKNNYNRMLDLYRLSQKSATAAKRNFDKSQSLYYQGVLTNVEFRQAQLNLNRIENQLAASKINLKLAEVELMRLSGQLF